MLRLRPSSASLHSDSAQHDTILHWHTKTWVTLSRAVLDTGVGAKTCIQRQKPPGQRVRTTTLRRKTTSIVAHLGERQSRYGNY